MCPSHHHFESYKRRNIMQFGFLAVGIVITLVPISFLGAFGVYSKVSEDFEIFMREVALFMVGVAVISASVSIITT
jgi:nitrate reductase NapE component